MNRESELREEGWAIVVVWKSGGFSYQVYPMSSYPLMTGAATLKAELLNYGS